MSTQRKLLSLRREWLTRLHFTRISFSVRNRMSRQSILKRIVTAVMQLYLFSSYLQLQRIKKKQILDEKQSV